MGNNSYCSKNEDNRKGQDVRLASHQGCGNPPVTSLPTHLDIRPLHEKCHPSLSFTCSRQLFQDMHWPRVCLPSTLCGAVPESAGSPIAYVAKEGEVLHALHFRNGQ